MTGLASASSLPSGSARASSQEVLRYGADVALVRLSVTARDARGRLVSDLRPEELQVFEDGVQQQITRFGHHETAISVVVLFDRSMSMRGEKLMHAKDAVRHFVRSLRRQDEVLVIAFSDSIDMLGRFGLSTSTVERAVEDISVASATRLYDAVDEASRAIASPERNEKRAILILSDGADTGSSATLEEAVESVRGAGAPVYALGIELDGGDRPPSGDPLWTRLSGPSPGEALELITAGTGGWAYVLTAAARCKEICKRVADELRDQYLLGYTPAGQEGDRPWRTIRVRTTRPNVTVTTRSGYYATPP